MAPGLGHWYIEVQKQAYWRGSPKTWVNRYIMSGSDPTAGDAFNVATALKNIEDVIHPRVAAGNGVGFRTLRGYKSTGGAPMFEVDLNPGGAAGTATGFTGPSVAGVVWAPTLETCLLVETKLNGLSSRGKPVYLRKFFRGWSVQTDEDLAPAPIAPSIVAAIDAACTPWQTGLGANNWVVIGRSGRQAASAPTVHPYMVAHQIPRGRKRKKTTVAASANGTLSTLTEILQAGAAAKQLLQDLPILPIE